MSDRYVVRVPAPGPAVTLNRRLHWGAEAKAKHEWRDAAFWCAASHAPRLRHLDGRWLVTASYPVKSLLVRRDPHNWVRTTKWIIDGFVDAGVWLDDDQHHVAVADAQFHIQPAGVVTLTLTRIEEVDRDASDVG
jgi:hypothetical protein